MPRGTPFKSQVLAVPTTGFVAAAKNFTIGRARRNWVGSAAQRAGDEWQNAAWDFYDVIGEYRYGVDWVGNLLSKATLFPMQGGAPTTDQRALDAMASLYGGTEGQSEMLRQLGIQFTVAGEAYIVGVDENGEDGWYVIAATEISRDGDNQFAFGQGSDKVSVSTSASMVIRIWRPHPRRPKKATSPSRAVLPILSEIERLSMHVSAQIESRLTSAGILILPSQFSFPTLPTSKADPSDPDADPISSQQASPAQSFANLLVEIASIAIDSPQDASAKVPIVAQVDGEYIDKVQYLKFWTDLDEHAIELRKEAIRRLALGMDMPPEVLEGTADTNHWAAWQIDESAIKSHSEPLLACITSSLTVGYLRPVLESMGMSAEEAAEFSIGVDTSELRLRPNRSKEAMELWDRGILSDAALLRENGFDESDAMTEADRTKWLTIKLAQGQTTPDLVAQGLTLLGVPIQAVQPPADETHEARPTPSTAEHPSTGAPNDGEVPEELLTASEIIVFRAMERAGNRLKNRISGHLPAMTSAADLYLRMPTLTEAELDLLLDDAWSCTERFSLGVDTTTLILTLGTYTRTIMALRKPHDRALLREHLSLMRLGAARSA